MSMLANVCDDYFETPKGDETIQSIDIACNDVCEIVIMALDELAYPVPNIDKVGTLLKAGLAVMAMAAPTMDRLLDQQRDLPGAGTPK